MEFEISKLRQLLSILGDLFCFDGDVIVFQGDICVILVVYGFGEVKVIKELLDKVIIDVVYKLKSGLLGCVEKLLERIIRNFCEIVIFGNFYFRLFIFIIV